MGSRNKQVIFEDEIENNSERRRSNRIISLEEKKKQQEKERMLALALDQRKNKAKEKATIIDEENCLDEFNNNEDDEALHQLISLIKEGQCPKNASNSRTNNASCLNNMPQKNVLEFILDLLQWKDPDELFAEAVNPNAVKNYYEIVKQPMDFGTMRAKLHEGIYTTLQQFKRDVYLICSNSMNAYPPTSRHHKVAEIISCQAKSVFEVVHANQEHFKPELPFDDKKLTTKRVKDKQQRSSRHERVKDSKLTGRNNSIVSKTKRRDMYWPPNKNNSLLAEFLNSNKSNIQFTTRDPSNYKDNLLRFVKDLGPTAQRIAAKKLDVLKYPKLCNDDPPTYSLLKNVSQPTDQPVSLSTQPLCLTPRSFNRQLLSSREFIRPLSVSSDTLSFKELTNDRWHACATALLSSGFGECGRGTKPLWDHIQEGTNQIHQQMLRNNQIGGSSNHMCAHVYPTLVISGHEPKQLESSISGEVTPLLLWDNDVNPNLALQL